jgi:hypothetical protein
VRSDLLSHRRIFNQKRNSRLHWDCQMCCKPAMPDMNVLHSFLQGQIPSQAVECGEESRPDRQGGVAVRTMTEY